jgi:hypothetical protein
MATYKKIRGNLVTPTTFAATARERTEVKNNAESVQRLHLLPQSESNLPVEEMRYLWRRKSILD